jgi:recombination protein RecT
MNNELQKQPLSLKRMLDDPAIKKRFEDMLGKKAPGFISSIISAVSTNKMLSECDQGSVIGAAALAAALDLPINANLGFAYIVPYKGKAQFQIGYKGLIQLAHRTGAYQKMECSDVCEGEVLGHDKFRGDFTFGVKTSEKVVGHMFYFKLLSGFEKFFYMSTEDLMAHGKKYSPSFSYPTGQWKTNTLAMCRKTVVKQCLNKWGVLSVEMQLAIARDQAVMNIDGEFEEYPDVIDVEQKYSVPEAVQDIPFGCMVCGVPITKDAHDLSLEFHGKPLCQEHQKNVTATV